jgi:hypothetical protein
MELSVIRRGGLLLAPLELLLLHFPDLRRRKVNQQYCESAAAAQGFLDQDEICSVDAVSFLGWRFTNVICLIRAESDGLHVATSGSSLKAL